MFFLLILVSVSEILGASIARRGFTANRAAADAEVCRKVLLFSFNVLILIQFD
jgi:hypothetical protein